MFFEERELTPYSLPMSADDLKEGVVYFAVNYIDPEMLIPTLEPLVFIGRDLEPGDSGQVYFQDIESYGRGIRYHEVSSDTGIAKFSSGSETAVRHLFNYERALEELMRCSVRRRHRELAHDASQS